MATLHATMLLFLLTCCPLLHARGSMDDEVERGDEYIDKLLQDMLEENGHTYDPYLLEDSRIAFWKKIAFVNISGEAKLYDGYITGLKTLHRPDHCSVEKLNDKLLVKADLGAGVMNFHYAGTVKFMTFGPTINILGEVAYLEIHMEFEVDAKTGRNGKLTKFYFDDMKGMSVKITGLGPVNWVLSYMVNAVTKTFKGMTKNMLEKKVRNHLAERLPRYQFPVDETLTDVPIIPETEAPVVPETEEPKIPETEVPETEETEVPETEETEVPETEETEVPETEETEVPETEETEVPETEETEVPETEEPEVPETEKTEIPETEEPEVSETDPEVIQE